MSIVRDPVERAGSPQTEVLISKGDLTNKKKMCIMLFKKLGDYSVQATLL
jgi:hypothetical protein